MTAPTSSDHPITSRRQELGLTQEALAGKAKIDARTIRRAENGQRVSAETLQALAHALEIDITVLTQRQTGRGQELTDDPLPNDGSRADDGEATPSDSPATAASANKAARILPVIRSDQMGRAKLVANAQHLFEPIDDIEMIVLPNLKPRLDRLWILVLLVSLGVLAWGLMYGWGFEPDPLQSAKITSIQELQAKAVSALKGLMAPLLPFGLAAIAFLKVLQTFQFIEPTLVYGIGPHTWLTVRYDKGQPSLKRITRQPDGQDGLAIYPYGNAMTCVLRDRKDEPRLTHLPNDARIREVLTRLERLHEEKTYADEDREVAAV